MVLDKGSLDALMGEDSPEAATAGRCYLRETARLLRSSGSFLCITLGQRHVLRMPLQSPGYPVHTQQLLRRWWHHAAQHGVRSGHGIMCSKHAITVEACRAEVLLPSSPFVRSCSPDPAPTYASCLVLWCSTAAWQPLLLAL